jgi:hypothetical protein
MNSTIIQVCKTHVPNKSAISFHNDEEFTFCEVCEENISRFFIDDDERLPYFSNWSVN